MEQQNHKSGDVIESIKELLVAENNLDFLRSVADDTLQNLHKELLSYQHRTDELQKPVYKVMAVSTQFIPNFIIAKLAHDFLTPYIIAQVCIHMEPKAAAKIARSLNKDYMGEVAVYGDLEVIARIANEMDPQLITDVVKEMIKFDFFNKLGELATLLHDPTLGKVVNRLRDPASTAKIIESMSDTDKVVRISRDLAKDVKEKIKEELRKIGLNELADKLV